MDRSFQVLKQGDMDLIIGSSAAGKECHKQDSQDIDTEYQDENELADMQIRISRGVFT